MGDLIDRWLDVAALTIIVRPFVALGVFAAVVALALMVTGALVVRADVRAEHGRIR